MAQALRLQDGIGRKDLEAIRQRFFALHQERLRRILGELRPSQQDCIRLLPLLFHINHPMLPGFVNTDTPAGISNYGPSHLELRIARKLSRSFAYKKRARRRYWIRGLYLMGSTGTIAHTADSDFDVWLCHDRALDDEQKEALRTKALNIERWAEELGLEVHIFVMEVESFRQGTKATLSHDSSGSTQHGLLLEEFYRTAVFLAGCYPLWWLIPPHQDTDYSAYAAMLLRKRFVNRRDCLDFGGLEKFPAGEFFGAALWQLFKGIEAPYKSVLKILLMETYARDYPSPNWLSQQTKAAIYAGETDLAKLDPYVMMYRQVEHYLQQRGEPQRVELARRCLYFKVGERLSRSHEYSRRSWRSDQLLCLTREWEWQPVDLVVLDSRPQWKMDRVMEERNALVRELSRSFRILTDFARAHADSRHIDPIELGLLGRKLYTALERRPGKVELINPHISKDLVEPYLSLHHTPAHGADQGWFLYRGQVDEALAQECGPIKSTLGLIEMLTWCHINRISNQHTIFALYPADCPVTSMELHAVLDTLRYFYPDGEQPKADMSDLSHAACARSSALFINVGADPMERLTREGKQLTSNRSDPLSFGAVHTSLVANLEHLVTTSWGELLIHRHQGISGLLDALCDFLGMTLLARPAEPAPPTCAYSYSSIRARSIAQRVAEVFHDVCEAFGPVGTGQGTRYVLQADDDYVIIQSNRKRFSWLKVETLDELIELLGEPQTEFRPPVIDRFALADSQLPILFKFNRPDRIQWFYHVKFRQVDLFVLDERGALFRQTLDCDDHRFLLVQEHRFLTSLLRYRSLFSLASGNELLLAELECYRLTRDWEGHWRSKPQRPRRDRTLEDYVELRLTTQDRSQHSGAFTLTCGDREFNGLECGDAIYEQVVRYLLTLRHNHNRYAIYLTSVETNDAHGGDGPASIELLNLKKRVESRLNKALADILKEQKQ